MMDVTDRLARLDGSATFPGQEVVAADMVRASTAMARRRRTVAAAAGVGLTLAFGAGVGISAIVSSEDATPATIAQPPTDARAAIDLVAYEGKQPQGFRVAQVPEGFVVQGSDSFVFTVARADDTSHPLGFEDKLVVMLESQSKQPGVVEGDPVEVGGKPGGIRSDGQATTLEYHDGSFEVVVQMATSVGLTDEQLVEFAEGIIVTENAQAGIG